jgi:hypothetical protein
LTVRVSLLLDYPALLRRTVGYLPPPIPPTAALELAVQGVGATVAPNSPGRLCLFNIRQNLGLFLNNSRFFWRSESPAVLKIISTASGSMPAVDRQYCW